MEQLEDAMGIFFRYICLTLVVFAPLRSVACPLCHSSTADEVRAGLLSTSLDGITIAALILPFALIAVTVYAIEFDWRAFLKGSGTRYVRSNEGLEEL